MFAVFPDRVVRIARVAGALMKLRPVRALAVRAMDALVEGPDREELEGGSSRVWAQARAPSGEAATVELLTPNGYVLTARAAVAAVTEVLAGRVEPGPGVHTPSRAFGAGWVLGLEGVDGA